MTIAVVVPTIREDCAFRWLREWTADLEGVRIIIIEDNPEPSFDLPGTDHYAWNSIETDLGDDAWIIPRRTSACRSYGYLKALEDPETDIIWTTDDDCYPEDCNKGRQLSMFRNRLEGYWPDDRWWNTIEGSGLYPRGFPYESSRGLQNTVLHHGLWSNIPDLDGITQLANPDFRLPVQPFFEKVPYGSLFTMCIMNVAFRREFTPALYMLLMGKDREGSPWGFDRFDDIWAGLFVKKIADHLGMAVTSGSPGVHHSRASNPEKNKELEALGIVAHEEFWRYIDAVPLSASTVADCYDELASAVKECRIQPPACRGNYWTHLGNAMGTWNRLVRERL